MKIPTPEQIGLPAKFTRWRPEQEEALRKLLMSQHRTKAVCAPTGFGKTPVDVAYALLTKKPTCFVTDSRGLQDQMMEDFQEIGLVDLRGRANYPCDIRDDYTCQEGYAARCPYKGTINCPASQAEMRAATSSLVVTNYDKWTAARKYGQGMQHFQQVIFDEGHKAPDAIARAMQIILHHKEIEETVGMDFPRNPEDMVNWKPWAVEARAEAEQAMIAARDSLSPDPSDNKASWVKHYLHLRNLTKRLGVLATANPNNWVVDEHLNQKRTSDGYQFDPVRVGRYGEAVLFLKIPSVVVISATLQPKTMYLLGVGKGQFQFDEYQSDFDPNRSPVYYIPTMQVDKNHPDLSMLWIKLDQIAARRTDRKGIVHTISYGRRDGILQSSRFASSMIVNPRGEPARETIEQFRHAGPGTILVSPSVGEGYDFRMSECEWQFVCKIPFPDGRSKIQQARQEDDKEYGPYQAATKLEQIFGRGSRSREDACEGFIGDTNLNWFWPRYKHLTSQSFRRRFREVAIVPPPPPKL